MSEIVPTIEENEKFEHWLDQQLTGDWAQDDLETNLRMAVSTIRDMSKQTPKDFAVQPLIRFITYLMDKREIEGQIKLIQRLENLTTDIDDGNGYVHRGLPFDTVIKHVRDKLEQQLKSLNSNEESGE